MIKSITKKSYKWSKVKMACFILLLSFGVSTKSIGQIYLNAFTGASGCPTNGNTPAMATNSTGTALSRSTITCNATANVFNSTTLNNTASISNTSYIQFSATANAGFQLNLTSLSFLRQGSNTAPNQLEVRYSTDAFATSTAWGAAPNTPTSGTTATWDFTDFSTANGGTVTFRVYPFGTQRADLTAPAAASTGTFRLDDVTLNGTVTLVPATPTIVLSSPSQIASGNLAQGSTDQAISNFQAAVTTANATLNTLSFVTGNGGGSYNASDITNFKLFYNSSSNTFGSAVQIGSQPGAGVGSTVTFSGLSSVINSGSTGFFWITSTVSGAATPGNSLNVNASPTLTFASGTPTGSISAGGNQTITALSPTISLANGTVASGNSIQNTTNNVLYRTDVSVSVTGATLNSATFTTAGSYAASDISNLKLWYQTTPTFTGSGTLLSTKTTGLGAGTQLFSSLSQSFPIGTGYLFVTTDVPCAATIGNTININAINAGSLSFASGTPTGSTFTAGGTQTITSNTPVNATSPAAVGTGNSGEVSVSWINPTGCFDEIMIVAAPASNTGTPTGDGSAYTANLAYGTGTALGNGFVVYKGSASPQLITGLTNGTTYSFKLFTRSGSNWSAGTTDVTATPSAAVNITEVLLPQYMQGVNGTNSNRLPYACLLTINNLSPNATYRYIPSVVITSDGATGTGAGNCIFPSAGGYTRSTSPSLSSAGNFGTFTTNNSGSYTGWFIIEPSGNATRFIPGNNVNIRINLNDGAGGSSVVNRATTTNTVKIINLVASAGANNGSGLRGSSAATAKNLIVLYDNVAGTGRPIAASFVESDGTVNTTGNSYASFYSTNVENVAGAYGVIIPNTNANGIRRIEQRTLSTGSIVGCPSVDADGNWPGGANTVNPTSGTTALVLTASDANLLFTAAAASQTNVSCNAGTDGAATVSLTGGNAAFVYSWTPAGGSAASATGLAAGNYTCNITDNIGCTASQAFAITEPTAITSSIGSTSISCNGATNGTATVSASGGTGTLSYSWTPSGGSAATAMNLSAGTYTCTITDANGCTTTQTATITEPTALSSSLSSQTNVNCNGGSDGTATVMVSGGTPSYTYSWAPSGGTAATAMNLSAGTYTCTITDANGCTTTQTVTITQPSMPISANSSMTQANCSSNNGTITLTVSGGTPVYTFSWSNGAMTQNISGLAAGGYTVTVTDSRGCTTVHSTTVTMGCTVPNTQLVSTQCGQVIPDLSGSFYCNPVSGAQDYEWEITNTSLGYSTTLLRGLGVNAITKTNFANLQFGQTYNVRVRAKVGGVLGNFSTSCSITLGTPVSQFLASDCGRVFPDLSGWFYCKEVFGAQDYEWEFTNSSLGYTFIKVRNQATTSLLRSAVTGLQFGQTYDVRVRSKVGGIWGSFGPTCSFTMGALPTTKLIASQCGTTFNLSGFCYCDAISGAQDYEWEFTGTGYSYTLLRGTGISSLPRPSITGLQNGQSYSVRVRAKVGGVWGTFGTSCSFTVNTSASTRIIGEETIVEDTKENIMDFVAYPNPFNSTISIAITNDENAEMQETTSVLEIFNAIGEKIYSSKPTGSIVELDLKEWSNGVYYIMLTRDGNRISKKILKQE